MKVRSGVPKGVPERNDGEFERMTIHLNDLRESNEFLNFLIDSIDSAVFLVDKEMRVHRFNFAMCGIFHEVSEGKLCGNGLGCVFAEEEKKRCGETSHCRRCELRTSLKLARTMSTPGYREKLVREFYIDGSPVLMHLEYSTKSIVYDNEEMILVIVDDVTKSEQQKLELLEKQRKIDEDLQAAAGIQRSLLPRKCPQFDHLDIAWKFLPCDIIGGDIFNVFRLDENRLACYMIDVSGHGVPAALVTVSISQTLHAALLQEGPLSPAQICTDLDREYPFDRFGTFFTMIYLEMDIARGRINYCNAGHPPMILLRSNGKLELPAEGGPLIGLGGSVPYVEAWCDIEEGDRLILYTDGLVEHRNSQKAIFGTERFCSILKESRGAPLDMALDGVLDGVLRFDETFPLRDDLSLLGIELKRRKG